jgi:hypothetical protein
MIYHLELARRAAADHARRVHESMRGVMEEMTGAPEHKGFDTVPDVSALIRLIATSPDFRSVVRDWVNVRFKVYIDDSLRAISCRHADMAVASPVNTRMALINGPMRSAVNPRVNTFTALNLNVVLRMA